MNDSAPRHLQKKKKIRKGSHRGAIRERERGLPEYGGSVGAAVAALGSQRCRFCATIIREILNRKAKGKFEDVSNILLIIRVF